LTSAYLVHTRQHDSRFSSIFVSRRHRSLSHFHNRSIGFRCRGNIQAGFFGVAANNCITYNIAKKANHLTDQERKRSKTRQVSSVLKYLHQRAGTRTQYLVQRVSAPLHAYQMTPRARRGGGGCTFLLNLAFWDILNLGEGLASKPWLIPTRVSQPCSEWGVGALWTRFCDLFSW